MTGLWITNWSRLVSLRSGDGDSIGWSGSSRADGVFYLRALFCAGQALFDCGGNRFLNLRRFSRFIL